MPSLCDFLIDRRRGAIECRLDPSSEPAFVALLVSGLVVAFLLTLDGHCVLHASAVEVDGAGVAFAGPSGSGKSTLATLACAAGGRLITDDVLRLDLGPQVACVGGSPEIRLRTGSAWALDDFARPPATRSTVDGRLAVAPAAPRRAPAPLAAIVLPRLSRHATTFDLAPIGGAAAVARLAAVARVGGWTDPDVLRAQFRAFGHVAARVPVVEAAIPWGTPSSAIIGALRELAGQPV